MRRQLGVAEIAGGVVVCRRDDVPARPPAGDVVERAKLAGNVVGFGEAGRHRAAKPDPRCLSGESGEQRHRLELVHVHREPAPGMQVLGARGRRIGDKEHVELAALSGLRDLAELADICRSCGIGVRMQPGGRVVSGRLVDEDRQRYSPFLCHLPLLPRASPWQDCPSGLAAGKDIDPAASADGSRFEIPMARPAPGTDPARCVTVLLALSKGEVGNGYCHPARCPSNVQMIVSLAADGLEPPILGVPWHSSSRSIWRFLHRFP